MLYNSTRDNSVSVTAAKAITQGLSYEGGLFVANELPYYDYDRLSGLVDNSYNERAKSILSDFLTDFTPEQISSCVDKAYTTNKFASHSITEMVHLFDGTYMLELWHGKTCAFKDMALQLLPHLLTTSMKIVQNDKEIIILVATSGDTGKAALEGFKNVDGTKIMVFYPASGVSPMQKRQMATQDGDNVYVCAINGNFDDAQTAVKSIFTDKALESDLMAHGKMFSSANSINWGRLVPQIIYYISSYVELVKDEEIAMGDLVNVVVPTGNFGNILAAYYAKKMGVPLGKLICASNENNVLTDFINTGIYDKNRDFKATISPSMDILISSNLERLLYDLASKDDYAVKNWYEQLSSSGKFQVTADVKAALSEHFYAGFCTDEQTKDTIKDIFDKYSYLCDTHTAVALKVFADYKAQTGDTKKAIVVSTANPYKFADNVLSSICDSMVADEYQNIDKLFELTGLEVPESLSNLKNAQLRFTDLIEKTQIRAKVSEMV